MTANRILFLYCFSFVALVSGCSSNSTPAHDNSNNNNSTVLNVGGSYIEAMWMDNSNLTDTSTYRVVAILPTYDGKSNVIAFLKDYFVATNDTMFVAVESGGDVWEKSGLVASGTKWLLRPYGSHTSRSLTVDDGVISTTWITEGEGTGSFSFNGKDYITNKVKRRILTGTSGGNPNDTVVYHDAFSPDLGVQVSSDQESHYVLGALQAGEHWRLVGYKQK